MVGDPLSFDTEAEPMGKETNIPWCHSTWNGWRGCTKISPGCANCYAAAGSKRSPDILGIWGPNGTRVVASEDMWGQPVKWDRQARQAGERRSVFTLSYGDFFEDWQGKMVSSNGHTIYAPEGKPWWRSLGGPPPDDSYRLLTMDDTRLRVVDLMRSTPNLDWLLLTKRIERALDYWAVHPIPSNVRQGVSIENQATADERLPLLCQIGTPTFVSLEPMLGPVDLRLGTRLGRVGWVIVGGESGPNARPFRVEWGIDVMEQCEDQGVPFFWKQMGALPCDRHGKPFKLQESHGGDWMEWPEELRVRQFPEIVEVRS